jgi:hypothetical protein
MMPPPPDNCPRCNTKWQPKDYMISYQQYFVAVCKVCRLAYQDGDYDLYVDGWLNGRLDSIMWICHDENEGRETFGEGKPYSRPHKNGTVIFDFSFWLPFDITEEKLNKLLLLQ